MPQYHNHTLNGWGKMIVKPLPFWRQIFPFKHIPYFVGDKIRFSVEIETYPTNLYSVPFICERFPNHEKVLRGVDEAKFTVEGNIISREGDVEYSFEFTEKGQGMHTLLTARVVNSDRWALGCVGFVLGIIGAIVAGIILAWLQIDPLWHIENPFW